jgi:hypothetical protein
MNTEEKRKIEQRQAFMFQVNAVEHALMLERLTGKNIEPPTNIGKRRWEAMKLMFSRLGDDAKDILLTQKESK